MSEAGAGGDGEEPDGAPADGAGADGGKERGPEETAAGRSGGAPDDLLAEAVDRMAHQLKNPLQAVAMNLEVIRMRVRKEAPDLWEEIERYGDAVDENVTVLDRRVRMLLRLGRRSPGGPRESVDLARLVADFAEALQLDAERPAVGVEARGTQLAARARPGYVLGLVLDLWRTVRDRSPDAGELPLSVTAGEAEVRMEARLPPASVPGAAGREGWEETARRAGGRLEVREEDGAAGVELVLPTD